MGVLCYRVGHNNKEVRSGWVGSNGLSIDADNGREVKIRIPTPSLSATMISTREPAYAV